ncbi:hypothetical protein D3C84_1289870 [compost metagenome]
MHQCPETQLQMLAMLFELADGLLQRRRLIHHQPQQAGAGTNAGHILAQIVVQGLGQLGALLFLHGQ